MKKSVRNSFFILLYVLRQACNRHHDGSRDQSNHTTHDDNHDWLDDGAHTIDGNFNFFIVKIGNFYENGKT